MNSTPAPTFAVGDWVMWTLTRPVYGLRGRTEVRGKVVKVFDDFLTLEVFTGGRPQRYLVLTDHCKPLDE